MAHDVFISYSSKDINVAHAVCAKFEQEGVRCWYAPRDIMPGDEWASAIMTAIRSSKVLVLIFTDFSNASVQVRREVDNAISSGITIIPFKLTSSSPSGGMKYYLSTLHWLDAVDRPLEDSIEDLLELVQNNLNGKEHVKAVEKGEEPYRKQKLTGRQIAQLVFGLLLLIPAVFFLILFATNPTLNSTAMLVILLLGLIPLVVSAAMLRTLSRKAKKKKTWLVCMLVCLVLTVAGVAKMVEVEKHAPSHMTSVDKDAEVSMNMANYTFAVRSGDGKVYYADRVGGVDGIYCVAEEGFFAGEQGECLVSGVLADNLALSDNQTLFYRDTTNNRMDMCALNLVTNESRILKRKETAQYYAGQSWVIFCLIDKISPSLSMITSDGRYEASYFDGKTDWFYYYEGRMYFIGPTGMLSVIGLSNISSVVSSDVTERFLIYDDMIYYSGSGGKGIYRMPLDHPGEIERMTAHRIWGMVICGDYLYYLNEDDNMALYRVPIIGGEDELVSQKSYTAVNVIGEGLYLCDSGLSYIRLLPEVY